MPVATSNSFVDGLRRLDSADPQYAVEFVDRLLAHLPTARVSDVHLRPDGGGLDIHWRKDGVLVPVGNFPAGVAANVIARLKVLAGLLTYRNDIPQEGRLRTDAAGLDIRLSTFPTLFGEKAVLRLFAEAGELQWLDDLGFPQYFRDRLQSLLTETAGAIIIAGPAGSGKTTTAYACLREIVRQTAGGRNVVSLEDPIEVPLAGVAQAQVNASVGFTLASGLRFLMRQDPEVILVGEIRDRETAEVALQGSLTGQLVVTTFHAGSAAGAICRLADMGIEPYVLRSGVLAVICQRLARRLCECARPLNQPDRWLGLPVQRAKGAVGCAKCDSTGYRGRIVLAEMLPIDRPEIAAAMLARRDADTLGHLAEAAGMTTLWKQATAAVEAGDTSPAEVRRVLGMRDNPG
jgi:type II secretory ATPase GspE/PulE/Tfp pilus assembly ATPase PilB-like protein